MVLWSGFGTRMTGMSSMWIAWGWFVCPHCVPVTGNDKAKGQQSHFQYAGRNICCGTFHRVAEACQTASGGEWLTLK